MTGSDDITIAGKISSAGGTSGVGANQPPGGGPITIIGAGNLLVNDAAIVAPFGQRIQREDHRRTDDGHHATPARAEPVRYGFTDRLSGSGDWPARSASR